MLPQFAPGPALLEALPQAPLRDDLGGQLVPFEPVSLAEMDSVALFERRDTKFVLSETRLAAFLEALAGRYRVLEIDSVDAKAKRQFLEDLTMRDADFLVDEFDRVDCGVDTTIEIECPECFQTQEVELPFDKGFFLPGKDRTARRKARSSSSPT